MKRYQIYSVDPNGAISGDRMIEATSDDEAVFAVRSMERALDTEVWEADRRVARVAAFGPK